MKILGITFGAIIALLLIAYAGVALYFTDRFMPNSNIGDINVSLMSAGDAEKVLVLSLIHIYDVQFVVSGEEVMQYAPLEGLAKVQPFDEDADFGLYCTPCLL